MIDEDAYREAWIASLGPAHFNRRTRYGKTCLAILRLFGDNELTIGDIVVKTGFEENHVRAAMKILADRNFVKSERIDSIALYSAA